jgi:hypothetical protein
LREYNLRDSKHPFTLVKNYWDIGVGIIKASCGFKHLGVFGGSGGGGKVAVIDLKKRKKVTTLQTAIKSILSLEICKMSGPEVFLMVFGSGSDYSQNKSDIIDISYLIGEEAIGKIEECICKRENDSGEVISLRKQLVCKTILIEELQSQTVTIPKLEREVQDLKSKQGEVMKLKQENASLRNALSQKEEDNEDLKNDLRKKNDQIINLHEQNKALTKELKILFELQNKNKSLKQFEEKHPNSKLELIQEVVNLENSNLQGGGKSKISDSIDNNDETMKVCQGDVNVVVDLPEAHKKTRKTKRIKKKNKARADG